jgi:hypothetical protein
MFLFLLEHIKNMHTLNIDSFFESLTKDDIFEKLAAFGEDVKIHFHKDCPHCKGGLTPLAMRMSQPFCGYLPISRPLYHECEKCGLVAEKEENLPVILPEISDYLPRDDGKSPLAKATKWMNVKCPFCGRSQPLRSIRSFTVKFNTRNMGDLVIEICCVDCEKLDTIYFRKEVDKITDVIPFLTGEKEPKSEPLLEEEMYKQKDNNVVEKMVISSRRS